MAVLSGESGAVQLHQEYTSGESQTDPLSADGKATATNRQKDQFGFE